MGIQTFNPLFATGYAVKASTTSRISTTANTADPDLTLTLGIGTWRVDTFVYMQGNGSTQIVCGLAQSGSNAIVSNGQVTTAAAAGTTAGTFPNATYTQGGQNTNITSARLQTVLVITGGPMTVFFSWGPFASFAINVSVLAGSWIRAEQLA